MKIVKFYKKCNQCYRICKKCCEFKEVDLKLKGSNPITLLRSIVCLNCHNGTCVGIDYKPRTVRKTMSGT